MTRDSKGDFITIRNVVKDFGGFRAVDDISIDIRQGEFFSLLGESGCGKTTLLRMLGGFETPSSGEIYLDGQPMSPVPPHQRPVNMVFQSYAIFPHLNVRDNIAYGLRKQKLSRAKRYEMADEMLDLIKLSGYGSRKANELSGGQRQRVALARALVLKPKVLLLDEPLGALDKKLREQMQVELRELQRSVGITFVFVTHDQEEALTLSDRIAVMSAGKVLQTDTPVGLYETPETSAVAAFIGTMNFFDGTVTGETHGKLEVDTPSLGHVQVAKTRHSAPKGSRVRIAIRPEKLTLTEGRDGEVQKRIAGEVNNATYFGEHSLFYVRLDGRDEPVAVSAQNRSRANGGLASGNVWLSWDDDEVVLLNDA